MSSQERLRCPVCRATFRGDRKCSRCGADLTPVMTLVAKAFLLRRASRASVGIGDFSRARELADKAQALHPTPRGRRLRLLLDVVAATR